eukprot:scaffold1080_cov159-Amphora_coffeaeformis.AAC.3
MCGWISSGPFMDNPVWHGRKAWHQKKICFGKGNGHVICPTFATNSGNHKTEIPLQVLQITFLQDGSRGIVFHDEIAFLPRLGMRQEQVQLSEPFGCKSITRPRFPSMLTEFLPNLIGIQTGQLFGRALKMN